MAVREFVVRARCRQFTICRWDPASSLLGNENLAGAHIDSLLLSMAGSTLQWHSGVVDTRTVWLATPKIFSV